MRIGSKETKGWKAAISVAMSNYIEAGSSIAIASSLSLWQEYLGIDGRNNWVSTITSPDCWLH